MIGCDEKNVISEGANHKVFDISKDGKPEAVLSLNPQNEATSVPFHKSQAASAGLWDGYVLLFRQKQSAMTLSMTGQMCGMRIGI